MKKNKLFNGISVSVLMVAAISQLSAYAQTQQVPIHSGTGFFINPEYVITNEHVLHDGCSKIMIQDRGRDWASAEIVVMDQARDLAALHTPKWPRDTATLRSDFEELQSGDKLEAVGFPIETLASHQDYEVSTANMVNPKESFGNASMLQFSHAIKLGYSGGPLLDNVGKVVGVVKGIATIYQTYSVGGRVGKKQYLGEIDEAINLISLEQFLMANNIPFHTAKKDEENDRGLDFTINVQCVDKSVAVQ